MTINDTDGMFALLGRVMERARLDARRGDVEAISFLTMTTKGQSAMSIDKLSKAVADAEAQFMRLVEEHEQHAETFKRALDTKDLQLARSLKVRRDELPQALATQAETVAAARLALAQATQRKLDAEYVATQAEFERLQAERDELLKRLAQVEERHAGLLANSLGAGEQVATAQKTLHEAGTVAFDLESDAGALSPDDALSTLGGLLFGPRFHWRHVKNNALPAGTVGADVGLTPVAA